MQIADCKSIMAVDQKLSILSKAPLVILGQEDLALNKILTYEVM